TAVTSASCGPAGGLPAFGGSVAPRPMNPASVTMASDRAPRMARPPSPDAPGAPCRSIPPWSSALQAEGERGRAGKHEAENRQHGAVAHRVGEIPEARGPGGLTEEDEGHEHADHSTAALPRRHVHDQGRQRRVEEPVCGTGNEAGEREQRPGGDAQTPRDETEDGQ